MKAFAASLGAALLASQTALAAPEEFTIDGAHTYPSFAVLHLGISTQRGRFDRTSGKVTLDREAGKGSIDIVIDATTVSTGNGSLDTALRGEDFFHVEKFPRMAFQSSRIEFDKDIPTRAIGEFTLLGVTRPVTLSIEHFGCTRLPLLVRTTCGADVVTTISRSAFGMTRYAKFIADEVKIVIQVEAVKVEAAPTPSSGG